ncbi:hypothetical protein GCM10022224_001930 [Nonomuraea antimicrobica]|uniref:Quercetin 2,3-dioxygenase n=1 Tax=Nonomuraea antimicrobica TaxID=561173 RepID=A0ABP7AY11_9ACTN
MKITPYDENGFRMDHPRGTVSFNYLLMGGEPEKLENFRYILGRQEGDFSMPRHRHTFEQIRLPLIGDMNLGEQGILHEGEIGYFPEGQTYGPQDDPLGDPRQLQLVLQFGGASGLGMAGGRGRGPDAQRDGIARRGERREMKFPRPRYQSVLIMNPAHFNWLPVPGADGVERKHLGSFTERQFWIEFVKIDAGAEWVSVSETGKQLMVVLSGQAVAEGTEIGELAALQVEPGEKLHVSAVEETVLYNVGLPPIQLPAIPSDQFDIITSDGAIQFEKARERV